MQLLQELINQSYVSTLMGNGLCQKWGRFPVMTRKLKRLYALTLAPNAMT